MRSRRVPEPCTWSGLCSHSACSAGGILPCVAALEAGIQWLFRLTPFPTVAECTCPEPSLAVPILTHCHVLGVVVPVQQLSMLVMSLTIGTELAIVSDSTRACHHLCLLTAGGSRSGATVLHQCSVVCAVLDSEGHGSTREYFAFILTHPMKLIANYLQLLLPIHRSPTNYSPWSVAPTIPSKSGSPNRLHLTSLERI
eukprot:1701880-Rhodomonas_salina.1